MKIELNQTTAVVLAGGFGTRIKHLLPEIPKPMAMVAGRPFLEWVVRYLAKQGIRRVVMSTGYRAEVIERHFQSLPVPGVEVTCVLEASPLGTGGGFLHAARTQGDLPPAWLILNGDSLVFANLLEAATLLSESRTEGVIVGRAVEDASRFGTLAIGPQGQLLRFEEKRPGQGVINGGVYLLRHSLLQKFPSQIPLSLERDVFPLLIAAGYKLKVAPTSAPFLDIGTPESLPQADAFIQENLFEFV